MIPEHVRAQVASELSALGGTLEQQSRIGNIAFAVAYLGPERDAEYLLEQMQDDDPLVKRACRIMLDALLDS